MLMLTQGPLVFVLTAMMAEEGEVQANHGKGNHTTQGPEAASSGSNKASAEDEGMSTSVVGSGNPGGGI